MQITFDCPVCSAPVRLDDVESLAVLPCGRCGAALEAPADGFKPSGQGRPPRLGRCLVCPSGDLFLRKDFPQRLGVGIVVVGLLASCVTWGMREMVATFAILFATAIVDLVLFLLVPDCVACYRCQARYRGEGCEGFGVFDLETHERHRQQAARMRDASARRGAGG